MTISLNAVLYFLAACVAVLVILLLFVPFGLILVNRWQHKIMVTQQQFYKDMKQNKKVMAGLKTAFTLLQALTPLRLPFWFRVASQVSQVLNRS